MHCALNQYQPDGCWCNSELLQSQLHFNNSSSTISLPTSTCHTMTAVLQEDSAEALQHPPAVSCSSDAIATIPWLISNKQSWLITYKVVHVDLLQTGLLIAQLTVHSHVHWSDEKTGLKSWEPSKLRRRQGGQGGPAWTK